jgi:hypothetical protein
LIALLEPKIGALLWKSDDFCKIQKQSSYLVLGKQLAWRNNYGVGNEKPLK